MSKSPGSKHWLQRQEKDPYVRKARQSHYRSRAAYKLAEIDKKDHLFRPRQTVIDLGAAPGSWSQYAADRIGDQGRVIAIDILPLEPIDNVLFIQGDFTEQVVYEGCLARLGGRCCDLVISDLAPNLSGIRATDQAASLYLAELARDLALEVLKPGGHLLVKVFQGEGIDVFRQSLREHFAKIVTRKPGASRDNSREFYVLARSYRL